MKTSALAAILWLGATQTVSFSNCCQGLLCPQKENCPPCGATSEEGRSCCDGETSPEGTTGNTTCVHIEPATDIVGEAVATMVVELSLTVIACHVDAIPEGVLGGEPRPSWGADPPGRPAASISIYLLDRDLRI